MYTMSYNNYKGGYKMSDKNQKNLTENKNLGENTLGENTKEKFEGTDSMNTCLVENVFRREVIGLRDLRTNLSEVIGRAINSFEEVLSGNAKKGGETASIISTTLLNEILEIYKFNPLLSFDEVTSQYEIALNEIGIYASGDTKDEAIKVLIDLVIDSTADYIENLELYMRTDLRKQYPYFLRITHCKNIKELLGVLNLDIKI